MLLQMTLPTRQVASKACAALEEVFAAAAAKGAFLQGILQTVLAQHFA